MKISFVTVNYNNCMLTINYINSVLSIKNINDSLVNIVIVDNNSKLEDYNYLKDNIQDDKRIRIIKLNNNVGYTKGLNVGLRHERDNHLDYIIATNNDIIFDPNFLNILRTKEFPEKTFLIIPDSITIDGWHQNPQWVEKKNNFKMKIIDIYYTNYFFAIIIDILLKLKRLYFPKKQSNYYLNSGQIYLSTGVCFIFTKKYLEICKYFEEIVFMWCEEGILAAQIEKNGGISYYEKDLKILHFESCSVNKIVNKEKYKMYKKSYWICKNYMNNNYVDCNVK